LKVVGGILDRRKSEGRHGGKGDRARRGCHTRHGGGNRGLPSLRRTVYRQVRGGAAPERRILAALWVNVL
jgi:hypothetical protein